MVPKQISAARGTPIDLRPSTRKGGAAPARSASCALLILTWGCADAGEAGRPSAETLGRVAREPNVQEGPGFYQELSWSPDGSTLLVSVLEISDEDPGFAYRIWKLDPEGGRASPISEGPRDYWTSWSPDGLRIAFAAPGAGGDLDIHTMARDGSDRLRLTDEPGDDTQPAWSPDGLRIAFISSRAGPGQLWLMKADGTEAGLLAESAGEAQNPAWAPDGGRLAFYETDGAGNDHVVVIETDGSNPTRVAEGLWPAWTPDGASLLYGRADGLYKIPAAGGAARLLIAGDVLAGELSPAGDRLAYIVQDSGSISIVVSDAEGRDARVLLVRPAPRW